MVGLRDAQVDGVFNLQSPEWHHQTSSDRGCRCCYHWGYGSASCPSSLITGESEAVPNSAAMVEQVGEVPLVSRRVAGLSPVGNYCLYHIETLISLFAMIELFAMETGRLTDPLWLNIMVKSNVRCDSCFSLWVLCLWSVPETGLGITNRTLCCRLHKVHLSIPCSPDISWVSKPHWKGNLGLFCGESVCSDVVISCIHLSYCIQL